MVPHDEMNSSVDRARCDADADDAGDRKAVLVAKPSELDAASKARSAGIGKRSFIFSEISVILGVAAVISSDSGAVVTIMTALANPIQPLLRQGEAMLPESLT